MAASSLAPLFTRIYEVLCDGNGDARTLGATDRFTRGSYPGQDPAHAARDARRAKRLWVQLTGLSAAPESPTSAKATYEATLRLDLTYVLDPEPLKTTAWATTQSTMALDQHRVAGVLGWPGNLTQTEASAATGLAGGQLLYVSTTVQEPQPAQRLWRASATFRGFVTLSH